jgi:hypothetical protein
MIKTNDLQPTTHNLLHVKYCLLFAFCLLLVAYCFLPSSALAAYNYTLMEKIPGFDISGSDFPGYILAIYKFGIWTVGIAALLMITIGGFMYFTSAGNTAKLGQAKQVIYDALFGLIIAMAAFLILYVINPDLVKVNISLKAVPAAVIPAVPVKPITPGVTFKNEASANLAAFISCMSTAVSNDITSTTDTHIPGTCNPTDPNESFHSSTRCQHTRYSCHYGGSNATCITTGSYAIDMSLIGASAKAVAAAAAACGVNAGNGGNYAETAKCLLNEGGTHHHISIGAWFSCGCDTGLKSCASQK